VHVQALHGINVLRGACSEACFAAPSQAFETHAHYDVSRSTQAMLWGHCHIAGMAGQ